MKKSLTAENWAEAALDAIARSGIEAAAVEPLARQLGVTKGSFYWHFPNREALLESVLALWEKKETTDIVRAVAEVADPRRRIQDVFRLANTSSHSGRLYLAFAAVSKDPLVGPVVRRVAEKQLDFLTCCYRDLGLDEVDARRWARFAYATFMGTLQMRRDDPDALPDGRELREYVRLCMATLIPRTRPSAVDTGTLRKAG